MNFLRKAMRKRGEPDVLVTDKLRSYGAALKEVGASLRHDMGRLANNRAENSRLPFDVSEGDAPVPAHEKSSEVCRRSCLRLEPPQP